MWGAQCFSGVGYCEIQKECVPLHQQTWREVSLGSGDIATLSPIATMVIIAQLVRASDCGSEGRGFESHWSPQGSLVLSLLHVLAAFYLISFVYNVF